MAIFQKSVLKKYLNDLKKEEVASAYTTFRSHFADAAKQANIKSSKEEQYQSGFLTDLFVHVLGYTLNPNIGYNLTTEHKNEKDSKKADGAILNNGAVVAVIELKGTNTLDLDHVETQAFGYKNNQKGCRYVVTSNFEKLRFYIEDSVEHIEFNLFKLSEEDFKVLYLCLQKDNLLADLPFKIKEASITEEQGITKKLYKDYSTFKRLLYQNIVALNPQFDKLLLYKKTQKLLDRFLFILFAEDKQLLPPNSIRVILQQWNQLKELDEDVPLYDRYKKYFGYMNTGHKGKQHDIFAYNGGLFAPDEVLDNIQVDDTLLYDSTHALSQYDFETEVDVNILGHIFEYSLNDVDAVTAETEGRELEKDKTRRKKDGVFYTPKYITKYIVENTVGKLCEEKKAELLILDDDYAGGKKKKDKKDLNQRLEDYRNWLLQLTILDPACGSGAFLNQALEFLITEHRKVDELRAKLFEDAIVMTDVENHILENNLYGVDLNEESIEIAKLSLWLRTARKGRKLSSLNKNIRNGNSLTDDPAVAGDKAFNWQEQFPDVFAKGGFDVVIGNPPYVGIKENKQYFESIYKVASSGDLYSLFYEKGINILKPNGLLGFITPSSLFTNLGFTIVREMLLDNTRLITLIDLGSNVFEAAAVDSAIVILAKEVKKDYAIEVAQKDFRYSSLSKKHLLSFDNYIFNITSTADSVLLSNKLIKGNRKLEDFVDFARGVEFGFNSEHIFDSAVESNYMPILCGGNINRYTLKFEDKYVKFDDTNTSIYKGREIYENEKILIRRIGASIMAVYDSNNYYNVCDVYNLTSKKDSKVSLLYLLAILNSKLINYFYDTKYKSVKKLFPKIPIQNLRQIPISEVSEEVQKPIMAKVINLLNINIVLTKTKDTLLYLLQSNFEIAKPSTKLQNWYELDFKDFLKELQKAKVTLTLAQQAEWMAYFNTEKQKALTLKNDIDKTDKEIDQLVYQLYGLTEEEIKIVEESVG